jgi:hypothetical protein
MMIGVFYAECRIYAHNTECRSADFRYTECRHAECRGVITTFLKLRHDTHQTTFVLTTLGK